MQNDNPACRPQYSVWRTLDAAVLIGALFFGSLTAMVYRYYRVIWFLLIPALVIPVVCRRLYDKSIDRSAAFRLCTGLLRTAGYLLVIGGLLYPMLLSQLGAMQWTYPLRRSLFLSQYDRNTQIADYLPERLPENASDYEALFLPKVLQGAATVSLRFYADSETLAAYQQYAAETCKKHLVCERLTDEFGNRQAPTSKWFAMMQQDGDNPEGAEAYILYEGCENTAVWMINPKTGYFRMVW